MFKFITKYSEVISCQKKLYNKKCHLLKPSELNLNWKKNVKKNFFKKGIIKIIYVGRFKVEKGIYSLLTIFSKLPKNIRLVLVGSGSKINEIDARVKVINYISNERKLIKTYDDANICILPSFTEAHPKVLDEALSRMRPVIIFNDIKHVINNRRGVFSIRRDFIELNKIIYHIKKNIKKINLELKYNKLPDKITFLRDLYKILSDV
jgi:glycosyltransferase involved in cell wall biosynthesis